MVGLTGNEQEIISFLAGRALAGTKGKKEEIDRLILLSDMKEEEIVEILKTIKNKMQ